jgi:hypothetical protein
VQLGRRTRERRWRDVGVVALLAVLAYDPTKPLWIDEFLHFAFGAFERTADAWSAVRHSVSGVNHGQTGAYVMLDFWLLKAFGADLVALRLPSIASTAFMLYAALRFFDTLGMPPVWRLVGCAALVSQRFLMAFAAEARPYMPLAAASVGALAYYVSPPDSRARLSTRSLGFASVLGGALMHPYFSVYWLFACAFGYLYLVASRQRSSSFRDLARHVDPALTLLGAAAYSAIGAATWIGAGRPAFAFDPFEWIGRGPSALRSLLVHLQFVQWGRGLFLGLAVASGVAVLVTREPAKRFRLAMPLVLLAGSIGISLALAYISYRNRYWIVPRQWVASIALASLAGTWLVYAVSRLLPRRLGVLVTALFAVVVSWNALTWAHERAAAWHAYATARHESPAKGSDDLGRLPRDNDEWVELARANLAADGEVWPVFRRFYGR